MRTSRVLAPPGRPAFNAIRIRNTYIQADPAVDLGELGEMSLTELIIETGIHDAIARKLNEKGTLSKNAIAEWIINNVRKTIIREQLTDPQFYEQMSKLLDDLIKQNRAAATAYEEFLKKAEALVKRLVGKQSDEGVPAALHGKREATVIYNNLPRILEAGRAEAARVAEPSADYGDDPVRLALEIDRVMRERAPAGWKGDQAREAQVLNALFPLLDRDREATRALFELIKNGCVATSGLRRQDGPPLASTVPGPPSCPATIRSNGANSNPPSSSSAFGGTCGMP